MGERLTNQRLRDTSIGECIGERSTNQRRLFGLWWRKAQQGRCDTRVLDSDRSLSKKSTISWVVSNSLGFTNLNEIIGGFSFISIILYAYLKLNKVVFWENLMLLLVQIIMFWKFNLAQCWNIGDVNVF